MFIHESSFIDDNVEIGQGTKIWHFSHILKDCKIGNDCSFGQNVVVCREIVEFKQKSAKNPEKVAKKSNFRDFFGHL